MYRFKETFSCYDENYKPYGILTESCSQYWHKHAFCGKDGFTIPCTGNKYLLRTPKLCGFESEYTFRFGALAKAAGISLYFGYDPDRHSGYNVSIEWDRKSTSMRVVLYSIIDERYSEVSSIPVKDAEFPTVGDIYWVKLICQTGKAILTLDGYDPFIFNVQYENGYTGFSRPHFIGSVTFTSVNLTAEFEENPLRAPTKVQIPLVNGGTMPLSLEYSFADIGGTTFLHVTLDGGPQYRNEENYNPYPCNKKGQYVVEKWFIEKPFFTYGGKKYLFKNGRLMLTDPGLAMKEVLSIVLDISELPLTVTVAVDNCNGGEIGFGYEMLEVNGYDTQSGGNEFRFSMDGDYLGEITPEDSFVLCSPEEKEATRIIPKNAFDYETVREHFAKAHYFAEDEEIFFQIKTNTEKKYLEYWAELQNVYGVRLSELSVSPDLNISHPSLPVGLYRIFLTVTYGGEPFKTVDTVFEVYDPEGKKCAPLESGLPIIFAMPNEQQYLDRDVFDPWNIGNPTNAEHFCSVNAFTGHVAEHRRIWEVTKLFARKWYVWLSDRRTMVDYDYHDHMDIVKNADYIYYPVDYEWAVMRSDLYNARYWGHDQPAFNKMLDEFIDAHEGAREKLCHTRGAKITQEVANGLYQYYRDEWRDFAKKRITDSFIKQNELFEKLNPGIKRACYGPFAVYTANMRTSKLSEDYGFELGDTLSDVIYTGFGQFEDYPISCAYQTYRGAFGVGATLVASPKLKMYPEQYDGSKGGCIDGAVYFANPPIGAYEKPSWFDTTSSREYVYNTPRKTVDGFEYWRSYGFMKTGMADNENTDRFIKEWRYVLEHQPKKPLRSAMMICEFTRTDDGFDGSYPGWKIPHNVSEEGIAYVYETTRLCGIPAGFFGDWQTLMTVSADDIDLLVIPSTEHAPKEAIAHIRRLYEKGVSLIAVSSVYGLEDIFGVRYAPKTVKYYAIKTDAKCESVYPYEETAHYEADGAKVVLWADDTPALYRHDRTALFNISPMVLGKTYFYQLAEAARSTNSTLLRQTATTIVKELSDPIATAEECGITLLEDNDGNTLILAIDYSEHDDAKIYMATEKTVYLNKKTYRDARCLDGKPIRRLLSKDGTLDGIVVTLRRHESALIQLI